MHFFAFVLFEQNEWHSCADNLRAVVRDRIRRYDVNVTVPKYRPACHCMGEKAWLADRITFDCRHV